jgi:hypothetical protein
MLQVNHRFVTTLKEDGDQRIYWKTLQVRAYITLQRQRRVEQILQLVITCLL